jgi:hypothetical protein
VIEEAYQFSKVVNRLSKQRSNTQIVCPRHPILRNKFRLAIDAREVQERVFKVWPILGLDFVIIARHTVKARIDNRLDRVLLAKQLLAFIQRLLARWEVTEEELGVGDGGEVEAVRFGHGAGGGGDGGGGLGGFGGVRGGDAFEDFAQEFEGEFGF